MQQGQLKSCVVQTANTKLFLFQDNDEVLSQSQIRTAQQPSLGSYHLGWSLLWSRTEIHQFLQSNRLIQLTSSWLFLPADIRLYK